MHFFVQKLQKDLVKREFDAASREDPDVADDEQDFAFQKLVKQAKKELKDSLTRLIYRAKYNLPPNDPRFLSLTDEEIVYEIVLQAEYRKWVEGMQEETEEEEGKIKVIYKNTDEYNEIYKKLDRGEDVDLAALMTPDEDWEKIDG